MTSTVLWSNPSPNQESDYASGREDNKYVLKLSQSIDNFEFIRIRWRPSLNGSTYNDAYITDIYIPVAQFRNNQVAPTDSSGYYTPFVYFGCYDGSSQCLQYKNSTTLNIYGQYPRYGAILNVYGCNFN